MSRGFVIAACYVSLANGTRGIAGQSRARGHWGGAKKSPSFEH
jgi:hypothetical protein